MKRRLVILRHAKSAWDSDAATDHDRPLNKRGRRDAPRIAAEIVELGWAPERVISSDAARARETWERMESLLGKKAKKVVFTRTLYHGGLPEVREVMRDIKKKVATVMLVGHNPGWEDVLCTLTSGTHRLTTCNAALVSISADSWEDALAQTSWKLEHLLRPKEL